MRSDLRASMACFMRVMSRPLVEVALLFAEPKSTLSTTRCQGLSLRRDSSIIAKCCVSCSSFCLRRASVYDVRSACQSRRVVSAFSFRSRLALSSLLIYWNRLLYDSCYLCYTASISANSSSVQSSSSFSAPLFYKRFVSGMNPPSVARLLLN